jgi:hypothetical protein
MQTPDEEKKSRNDALVRAQVAADREGDDLRIDGYRSPMHKSLREDFERYWSNNNRRANDGRD